MKSHYLALTIPRFLIPFALCFVSQWARAVTPAPDGGYPGANTAEGTDALFSLTTGVYNTANGSDALNRTTTGSDNVATGASALFSNTTGSLNTAVGDFALYRNTTASYNTAVGFQALFSNATGHDNTANGINALPNNTTGSNNVAIGSSALLSNTSGSLNTANGYQALYNNTIASHNTANGYKALYNNTTGTYNTATGDSALLNNTTGSYNTAYGSAALIGTTTSSRNTANGYGALHNNTTGSSNTADGYGALTGNTGGGYNIALGYNSGYYLTTGSFNIDIGASGVAGESSTIRIGSSQTRAFIAGIRGRTTGNMNAVPVVIDSVGQLGTVSSSRRFKKEIKPMDQSSEAILALKPVTFQYKSDTTATPQFGLIAEEVEKADRDLVVRDPDGKPYTVRYDAVNAMLLNEFLKEHRKVEQLETILAQQQKRIEALAGGLEKVSAQLAGYRSSQVALSKAVSPTDSSN